MADAPEASAPPTEAVANLHLDEVTGERVSKSELKKRQKNRQKEEERLKKAAAAPPKPAAAKKSNAEADEKELNPNVYISPPLLFPARSSMRGITDSGVAIFRDSIACHREAPQDPGTQPIPSQVQCYIQAAGFRQGLRIPQVGRAQEGR